MSQRVERTEGSACYFPEKHSPANELRRRSVNLFVFQVARSLSSRSLSVKFFDSCSISCHRWALARSLTSHPRSSITVCFFFSLSSRWPCILVNSPFSFMISHTLATRMNRKLRSKKRTFCTLPILNRFNFHSEAIDSCRGGPFFTIPFFN